MHFIDDADTGAAQPKNDRQKITNCTANIVCATRPCISYPGEERLDGVQEKPAVCDSYRCQSSIQSEDVQWISCTKESWQARPSKIRRIKTIWGKQQTTVAREKSEGVWDKQHSIGFSSVGASKSWEGCIQDKGRTAPGEEIWSLVLTELPTVIPREHEVVVEVVLCWKSERKKRKKAWKKKKRVVLASLEELAWKNFVQQCCGLVCLAWIIGHIHIVSSAALIVLVVSM
jgi:hypothetical protein